MQLLLCVYVSASDAVKPHMNILSLENSWFVSPKRADHGSGLRTKFGSGLAKILKFVGTCQYCGAAVSHVPAVAC
jgi:hypothetical protein